jgi:hypothetical protein
VPSPWPAICSTRPGDDCDKGYRDLASRASTGGDTGRFRGWAGAAASLGNPTSNKTDRTDADILEKALTSFGTGIAPSRHQQRDLPFYRDFADRFAAGGPIDDRDDNVNLIVHDRGLRIPVNVISHSG